MDATSIVARIEEIARNNGINGVELGRVLGKAKSPLTDWRNGQSLPTLKQLVTICDYFAVSADYILFGVSSEHEPIEEIYSQLDERGRQAVTGVALSELTRMENMPRLAEISERHRDKSLVHSDQDRVAPIKKKRTPKVGEHGKKKAE